MPTSVEEIDLKAGPGDWRLSRARPADDLAGLVIEYWEVKGSLSAFRETLLPNGYVEVMFNLGPSHQLIADGGTSTWDGAWFSGLHERSMVIESMNGTHLASARLHPLGAIELLGRKAAECVNTVVDLDVVLPGDASALRSAMLSAVSPASRFALLEEHLRCRRAPELAPPGFVRRAAARIEEAHGNLRVTSLHEELSVSRKHLAVSFSRNVGVPAKTYASIQRFVWTLQQLRGSTSVDWSKLALEAGYSDQSHLVRDFRRIGAESPTEYLRRLAPEADALLYDAG